MRCWAAGRWAAGSPATSRAPGWRCGSRTRPPSWPSSAREALLERTRGHVEAGLLDDVSATETVQAAADVEAAVDGADLVIEAVPEDPELKAEILARASQATDGIIATNTSSLPIAGLAESVEQPERFLGVHWFNPPEWTPGIEVIAGTATDRAVVSGCWSSCNGVGKQPAEVADRAGFVSNRLQMALLREALAIVAEGQTTREDLDTIVRSTFGFRLPFFGPFQIADMAGLDTYVGVYKTLERDVGPEFAPPQELRRARGGGARRREGRRRVRGVLRRGARPAAARARPPLRRAGEAAGGMIDASVLVVGGGAIGGVTAAKLTGAVRRVVVLDASEEHVARLNDGLKLDVLGDERTVRVEAVTEPPDEEFDFVLITLKAAHHEAVKPLKGTFVSLGNGLVQDRLEALVGKGNLISGIVEWGATNLGPGHLAQTTDGPFVVGPRAPSARSGWRRCCAGGGVQDRGRHPLDDLGEAARQQRVQRPRRGRGPDLRRGGRQPRRQGRRAAHVARGLRGRPRAGPPAREGARRRSGGARRGGRRRRSRPRWRATAPPTRRCSRTSSAARSPRST